MASCDSGPPGARSLYQRQVLRRQLERALVGEIRLDEADAPKFAGIDRFARIIANAGHQPRAVADRDA